MTATDISDHDPGIKETLSTLWPNLRYLSYGIVLVWVYLLMDYGVWRSGTDADGSTTAVAGAYFFGTSVVFLALAAVFAATKPRKADQIFESPLLFWLILCFSVMGTLSLIAAGPLIFPGIIPSAARDIFFFLGNVLCSMVAALEVLQCARRYCCLEPSRMLLCALLSEATAFLIFAVVSSYDKFRITESGPPASGIIALCLLPAVAWFFLSLPDSTLRTPPVVKATDPKGASAQKAAKSELRTVLSIWRLFLAIFVFAATASIVENCFASPQLTTDYQGDAQMTMLLRTVLALVLFLCSITVMNRIPLERFYLFTSTGIALSLALVSLFGIQNAVLKVVSNSLFFVLDLIVWCLLVLVVRARRYPVVPVFGIGFGCTCAGMFAGYFLNTRSDITLLLTTNKFFSAALIAIILVCATIVFNEKSFDEFLHDANADKIDLRQVAHNADLVAQPTTRKTGLWEQACLKVGERARLSKREQEILRQLADNRTPQDMASYLCISLSTVRTHTRNVYSKLDVHSRDELINLVRKECESLS